MVFEVLRENFLKEDQEIEFYTIQIRFLFLKIAEKSEIVVPLMVKYDILGHLSTLYSKVLAIECAKTQQDTIINILGIIADCFYTEENEYIAYLVSDSLKISEFIEELFSRFPDNMKIVTELLFC